MQQKFYPTLCGYSTEEVILDVHHIDGNRGNNSLGNLEVLCVWCHAWTHRLGNGDVAQRESSIFAR